MLVSSLIVFQGYGSWIRCCRSTNNRRILTHLKVHAHSRKIVLRAGSLRHIIVKLFIPNDSPVKISHSKIRIQFDHLCIILNRFGKVLYKHKIQSPSKIGIHIVRILHYTGRKIIDRCKMYGNLVFRKGGFFVCDTQLTFQYQTGIVNFHHLIIINQLLYRIDFFVISQDKHRFQIHTHIAVLHASTNFAVILRLTYLFFIIHDKTVELIDILIRLFTRIFIL